VALAVPGSERVLADVRDMDRGWFALALVLEIGSCLSFVMIFQHFFGEVGPRLAQLLAWTTIGAGALLPGGGAGGLAIAGQLTHRAGLPAGTVIRRSSALFFLTSAISVAAMAATGALLFTGVAAGPHDVVRAALPIAAALVAVAGVASLPRIRRARRRNSSWKHELVVGISEAERALTRRHPRLFGAIGYLVLDIGALWAAFMAVGDAPPGAALALAYIVGYIANAVPVPAGVAALDAGLVGALVLYGARPADAAAAVLVYRAIAFWIPALGGVLAYGLVRRDRSQFPAISPVPADERVPTFRP